MRLDDPIKKCAKVTSKLLTIVYKSKFTKFKLDEDPLQRRGYFLSFMNSLSKFSEAYMLVTNYPSIRGEELPDYDEKSTWNLLHAYIDVYN